MRNRPTIYLGTWLGVELRLDVMVLALIGLLFLNSLADVSGKHAAAGDIWAAVAHLVLLLVMMLCMFLHEVGHAVMARARGHRPTMILLSFVGLTFFDAKKARASDELWIALSGPLVNLTLALLLSPFFFLALAQRGGPPLFSLAGMATWQGFLAWVAMLNLVVAALNLSPLWPADGARAVRAWLARRRGYAAGTLRAVSISHGLWLMVAGLSVVFLTVIPLVQALSSANRARSTAALLAMYQFVVLLLAGVGIYYGWAENRRVRKLGEALAAEAVGPPPEFKPGTKAAANVVNTQTVPPAEPSQVDAIKDKAAEAVSTGKTMWKIAKASGKGAGWFARQGARVVGALLTNPEKKEDK
ncbi:MAG: hypothetical protein HS108_14770 [Planctomycetes bacterium]|nr:hypothetical protein [Planctomycetota bacterium]